MLGGLGINSYIRAKKSSMSNKTLALIKPDAVKDGQVGEILDMIIKDGFEIQAMKMIQLQKEDAKSFYAVHQDKPFYDNLTNYMASSPIVAAILKKEDAVASFRNLIGATDPSKAEKGTVRYKYAKSMEANAVHGSDSDENALKEAGFFFSNLEVVEP